MPKVKIVCLILATVLASVGTLLVITNLGGGEIPPIDVPTDDVNTYLDKPEGLTPADVTDVRENLFIAHKALLMRESFYGESVGATTSFGISQQVSNIRYVVGEFGKKNSFKQMVTKGVVPNAYQLYMWGDNYLFRNFDKVNSLDDVSWKNTASKLNESDFYNKFGHRSDKLTGYILNYDTVLSGKLEKVENGIYTYRFVLDTVESTLYLKQEMVTNGNLSAYPTFNKAEIVVTMDSEWNVKTLTTDCEYTAKTMGINARCSEDITETFYDHEGDLPEKDFFEQFFDADYSDVDQEKGALDVLLDMFSPYLNGEDLQVALAVNNGGTELVNALVSISGLDISDLSKLSVAAKIGDALNLAYEHGEGKIYLKYADLQASITVDGIMGFVATVAPLFADGGMGDGLGELDLNVDELLANLTYEISEDGAECVVSLPLSLGGLDVDAKLYADVDGDSFTFRSAVVKLGEITLTIEPHAWQVEQRQGEYPDMTGLLDAITLPVMNLRGDVNVGDVELNLEISVDVINLDVWATVQMNDEMVYLRYVDGVLYVTYGNVAIMLDTTNLGEIIEAVGGLLGADVPSLGSIDIDVNSILSALSFNLTSATPNISLAISGIEASVNFTKVDGVLYFDSVYASIGDGTINATFELNDRQAYKLDKVGDFVDGNALIESVLETVAAFKNSNGITAELSADVTVNGKAYALALTLKYNGGLYADLTLSGADGEMITVEIYFVDGTLYFDVNGIRQAIKLDLQQTNALDGDALQQLMAEVKELIAQLDNETLNGVVEGIQQLADKLAHARFSDFISLFRYEDGVLTIDVDLSQLDLDGFTVSVGLGQSLTLNVDGLKLGTTSISLAAAVKNSSEQIKAPTLNGYVNEFAVTVGGFTAYVKLDLYHKTVVGQTELMGGTVAFKYVDGAVYATYGKLGVKLNLSEINSIMDALSKFVELPDLSMGDVDVIETVKDLLDNLQFAKQATDDGYALTLEINGISVSVKFARANGKVKLSGVTVAVGELNVEVAAVEGISYDDVNVNGYFVNAGELLNTFADSIYSLINAQGFAFGIDGKLSLGSNTFTVVANVAISEGNVYATIKLSLGNANMLEGGLWIVNNVLYLDFGDLKLSVALPDSDETDGQLNLQDVKQTLQQFTGYNVYLDEIVELVLNLLDTDLESLRPAEILTMLTLADGKLTVGVNGETFGLSQLQLVVAAMQKGLQFTLSNLAYKDVELNLSGNVSSYTGQITAPNGDFTTNLKVIIDEQNTLYANVDLMNKVIKLQLVSRANNGKTATLDVLYSLTDNIIKITNGQNLYVSADINNIVEIVKEIDTIVKEFAGAEASSATSGLAGLSNVDLKAILSTLRISASGSSAELTLSALGFNVSATFAGGALSSIVIPVADGLTLTVKTTPNKAEYAEFPADNDSRYVRIDQVFNDYFYGNGESERGAIDALIHTNSWKFDFVSDSEISITNDDGSVSKYQIAAGSSLAFYYNVADKENIKLRAKLTVNKFEADKWKEFIILDVAFIDGRIYVTYDSNSSNKNVLKATVSVDAIKECINLLPSLYKVVPQLEDLINSLGDAMNEASGSLTLGNLASLFNEVTYNDEKVFTLSLNAGIIEGLGAIYLSAQQFGDNGLQLNTLSLNYNNISVNLNGIVVTASPSTENADGSRSFEYVDKYILSYLTESGGINSHMNLDSIRELLAAFVITADNVDENGNRSFAIEGTVHANMIGLAKVDIQIYVKVDIDKDNNVYLAVKIHRESATGLAGGLAYDDEGGDSYLLLNSDTQTVTLARNSVQKRKWCSKCGWSCSSTILHAIYRSDKKISDYDYKGSMSFLVTDLPLSDFVADTKTMVNYILELVNFSSTIEKPIKDAIGKENTNVYGIEDILKSYEYSYDAAKSQGTFAIGADLSAIDGALGPVTVNILHVGNFDDVYYDDDGNFHDGGVALTQINGSATMISVMNATFELNLTEPTSGLAHGYVTTNNYRW